MNLFTKSISFCAIALTGLVGCTQPDNTQANVPIPRASITQNSETDIRSTQTLSADDAAERVEDALENDPTLKPFDLDADDEGNEIILEGTVKDASHKALAEDIAKRTAPGFTIINRIKIQ